MVYVDALWNRGFRLRGRFVRSCHMVADTSGELDAMALRVGLKKAWRQTFPVPHYDLTSRRRERALRLGAVALPRREFVALVRRNKR